MAAGLSGSSPEGRSGSSPEGPGGSSPADLIGFGWQIAEATLATATSAHQLVTHWFLTPEDASVNRDDHFGSDERTLRFLGVALPTLIEQLGASMAVVALPWGLETEDGRPTLSVVALTAGATTVVETRALTRLSGSGDQPPFWRLEPGQVQPPDPVLRISSGLVI